MKTFFDGLKLPSKTNKTYEQKYKPAWIQSISQSGLLTVYFARGLYVPQIDQNNNRLLRSAAVNNLTITDLID